MSKQIPSYLKLVTDTICEPPSASAEDLAAIRSVCSAFERATGWCIEFETLVGSTPQSLMWSAPVDPGVGNSPGHIRLIAAAADEARAEAPRPATPLELAAPLAESVGRLWSELQSTRAALAQREAELAVGVPTIVREEGTESPSLSQRIDAVLRGGAEAIGCQAAALYLLDAATTELKLRASWGLPRKRLTEPARQLRGAVADLEALLGHAVVMADDQLHGYWKVPEPSFGSCVCVPVSSSAMPLGTLWAFCQSPREFTDHETNILEVVAGRLAAELEREVLVGEALSAREQSRQIAALERAQQDRLPRFAPLVDGWEIAALAHHAGAVGGTFYDWYALGAEAVGVLAADPLQHGLEGAMTAGALRAAARAVGPEHAEPQFLLERANSILWTGSGGAACAGMFHALVEGGSSTLCFASAGPMRVLAISADGCTALARPTRALGLYEQWRSAVVRRRFRSRELLLAYGTSFLCDTDELILSALDDRLTQALEPCLGRPAQQLVEIAGAILGAHPAIEASDRVLVVVKRR